jgi:hypothetical protein
MAHPCTTTHKGDLANSRHCKRVVVQDTLLLVKSRQAKSAFLEFSSIFCTAWKDGGHAILENAEQLVCVDIED